MARSTTAPLATHATRASGNRKFWENGLFQQAKAVANAAKHLPDKAEWLAEYLLEMTSFPKGKFDDQCDSTSQALDWIKTGSKYDGFFKWLELESDKAKKGTFGANRVLPPCPACQSKSVSDIGPQLRCLNCGNQWSQSARTYSLPNKADFLAGRWRL
jgi:hypothetical protein